MFTTTLFRIFQCLGLLLLSLFQPATLSVRGAEAVTNDDATVRTLLRDVHRIVLLGDSITQGGDYVTDCECWLLAHEFQVEVLNLGLGSETASNLSPTENAGHSKKYGAARA